MSKPAHLARLADWAARLTAGDIPEESRRAARYQILNMVATAHAAARSSETASVAQGLEGFAGPGGATVLATGQRRAPDHAALANAAWSMGQDFDDIIWMGHTGHSAVFAALAVAEHEGRSTGDLLTATVVANELAGRLGATSFLGPLNGQMWTFIHLCGAAAATAKLLGLDAERTTHALAIALAQPNFALQPGFMTPSSKLLAAATPTAAGVQAAYFARAGMTGAAEILEDPRGFFRRFSYLPLTFMLEGLGEFWAIQTLTVKTFPGCHYFQTACSALEEILARTGPLALDDVRSVRIETTKLGIEATRFAGEYAAAHGAVTPVNVNFDLKVTAAILLGAGKLTSHEVGPEWLREHSAQIRAWSGKITVTHTPALTLKTIGAVRAVASGREALRVVRLRDLAGLVRRYRQEYASDLLTPREAIGWVSALARLARRHRGSPAAARQDPSSIPLWFPNRVTVELRSGRREVAQVDLPVGSFCAPSMPGALEQKFLREAAPSLGPRRARRAWAAGLALGEGGGRLADFVRLCVPARR